MTKIHLKKSTIPTKSNGMKLQVLRIVRTYDQEELIHLLPWQEIVLS